MAIFPKEKQCSKCGQPFGCGGILGCWCSDVTLDAATLAMLKERYANCLCPSCLKEVSEAAHASVRANA